LAAVRGLLRDAVREGRMDDAAALAALEVALSMVDQFLDNVLLSPQ